MSENGLLQPGADGGVAGVSEATVRRRNKWKFIAGAGIIFAFSVTFAGLTLKALSIRAHTTSEFSAYVVEQGIGTAQLVDDESGMETDFAVLHLRSPIAYSQLEQKAASLMKTYYTLDGGDHLTIEYSSNSGTDVEADAVLLPGKASGHQTLALTLHENGQVHVVNQSVDWENGAGDAS